MSGEVTILFINKSTEGLNNICGTKIAHLRKELNISQRELADRLQLAGLDIDKNAIQRIECGKRFVTDIEIVYISKVLNVSYEDLLNN
jgi:transcriptional regulator with XRE-family HTH domain